MPEQTGCSMQNTDIPLMLLAISQALTIYIYILYCMRYLFIFPFYEAEECRMATIVE
jgi:hypothetical protein